MRRKKENHELFIYPIYHKKKEIVFQKKIGKRCFKITKSRNHLPHARNRFERESSFYPKDP